VEVPNSNIRRRCHCAFLFIVLAVVTVFPQQMFAEDSNAPAPLLEKGHQVDWWFVFKFNSASFPGCGGAERECLFGGDVRPYRLFSQQFVFASSESGELKQGSGCAGDTILDPVGSTFERIYSNALFYVVWNDQFYDDPTIKGCTKSCGAPWGHSKGVLAWNEAGEGLVLQVTTPSWPAAGSKDFPRNSDGNTLGCISDDNVEVSQDFFALRLSENDVKQVLFALINASVVTDPKNPQIVRNGGPAEIQELVNTLGKKSKSTAYTKTTLSTGAILISKPSRLHVPPWQMVSALLGGVSLRAATWWARPEIESTNSSTVIDCWDASLGKPGAVEIATTGHWGEQKFGLTGGLGADFNHAKIGVSTSVDTHYSIFGDMNQQGSISEPNCSSSQNGRGGLFFVLDNPALFDSLSDFIRSGPSTPQAATKESELPLPRLTNQLSGDRDK
jgi:hypothetical protein